MKKSSDFFHFFIFFKNIFYDALNERLAEKNRFHSIADIIYRPKNLFIEKKLYG